jgi:hypothetical protein
MILQAAMAAGIGILVFGGITFLILTPLMSIFAYSIIESIILKRNPPNTELQGLRKLVALVGSVILGIICAFLLTSFAFWLFFKDVTFD